MPESDWFTEAVIPAPPNVRIDYESTAGGRTTGWQVPVLLFQRRYDVDRDGERAQGSEWTDSRVVAGYTYDNLEFVAYDQANPPIRVADGR